MAAPAQISDYFGSYPDIDQGVPTSESEFNTLISRKQEFRELTPQVVESPPARGGAFPHQKFSVRYMTWYDRVMFVHDPGTGKSCIITHSAELFKNDYLKNPNDPTKIRRSFILLRGDTLVANIRDQIVCRCTDRVYETARALSADNEEQMRRRIRDAVKEWYEIITYGDFARMIRAHRNEEDLEKTMSNIAVYIDEAHNVVTESEVRSNRPPPTLMNQYPDETEYETIHRGLHKGKRNKVFLFTATPMINFAVSIVPLMNVILTLDFQMRRVHPDNELEFINLPLEYFEPYFRGRISYVRALQTGAMEEVMGDPIIEIDPVTKEEIRYYSRIYPCYMSTFQYRSYLSAMETESSGFFDHQRQCSNFVFPDGSFGGAGGRADNIKGFDKYIELRNGRYEFRQDENGQYLERILSEPNINQGLSLLSTKYATILEICRESYTNGQAEVIEDERGIIFIYFADYVHGSGLIALAMALRAQGYEEFRDSQSLFQQAQSPNNRRFVGPCGTGAETGIVRQARRDPAPRFAVITGETSETRTEAILDTLNAYENRYGQYLQVLIGSRTAREGINIYNAVGMIMASSSWNYSTNYQARERVFRATSHAVRIAEKRARLLRQGQNVDNVTFPVRVYNLAAVYEGDPNNQYEIFRQDNFDTIDPKLYSLAEQKDRQIRRIIRYAKQSAYDCWVNYNRNVRPNDVDGSPVCDYLPCAYQCAGIRQEFLTPLDRSTKILYYSQEEIANAEAALIDLFSRFYSLRIEELYQRVREKDPTVDEVFINSAIRKLIENNTRILDRMGFFGYLRESPDGTIYLETNPFEIQAHPENTAYSSVLIGTQDVNVNSFNSYLGGLNVANDAPKLIELANTNPNDDLFQQRLTQLSLASQVALLEQSLLRRMETGQTTDFDNNIIAAYNNVIFEIIEPVAALQTEATRLANQGKGRGRKRDPNKQPKLREIELEADYSNAKFDPSKPGERIVLHTLLNQQTHSQTSYSAVRRYLKGDGQIRILKMSEGVGWRNVNLYERMVYNSLIRQSIDQIHSHYEQFPIYGIMLPPKNELHIRDRENENARDARDVYDGRVCRIWPKPELVNILYRLGVGLPGPVPQMSRQVMIQTLRRQQAEAPGMNLDTFSDPLLIHYYAWYQFTKEEICDYLRQFFERTGRLFVGRVPQGYAGPTVGTIQTSPPVTVPDYNLPADLPPGSVPPIPGSILPEFVQSLPGGVAPTPQQNVNYIPLIPTDNFYVIPQDRAPISQPPPSPFELVIGAPLDVSSNVSPQDAMTRQ